MSLLKPPFCANPTCPEHYPEPRRAYSRFVGWGHYRTKAFGLVPRFRCLACGRTFSVQTFRVDYFAKKVVDYGGLAQRLSSCESLSAMGRALGLSTESVSNRVSRAARQVLALESRLSSCRRTDEDLAADGFESFCVSQYFPTNLHVLVGSRSQFIYAFDQVTLRRKGRMTEAQRARRAVLDRRFRPEPGGIRRSFARIATESLGVLSDGARPALTLWTDEHREYPRGIAISPCASALAGAGRLFHRTVPSRAARTRRNPLFPVNYLDREIRKDLHEHARETTCFGRNVNLQLERFAVYAWWHNHRKCHRARGGSESHAEVAGYDPALMARETRKLWKRRAWLSHTGLSEPMWRVWLREGKTPLRNKERQAPAYTRA
jgi:transposase-like protein